MTLGFYYHYPVFQSQGQHYLPGFLGCFVDALAHEVDRLLLVCHHIEENKNNLYDYALQGNNIEYVFIGARTPAWHRHLFHQRILQSAMQPLQQADYLLVRSPSPLAPFFHQVIALSKVVFLVVGDYEESVKELPTRGLRDWIMKKYIARNNFLFTKEMKRTHVLVNSPALFNKYKSIAKDIHTVKTTTLTSQDFYVREHLFANPEINLLYTGRLDAAKGLFELLDAFAELKRIIPNRKIQLHFVGWEDQAGKPVQAALQERAQTLQVSDTVFFHGKKKIGDELNALYRMADIYVIPSYHEGFPRTIWEAMANGLPVIATTVGAIPTYLQHKKNALLIEPKKVQAIVEAVQQLLQHPTLAKELVEQGYQLAKENTLAIQTKKMMEIIASYHKTPIA